MSKFTWLPFFEEMLNVICTKYDKESLCKVFHQIFEGIRGVKDKFQDGTSGAIKVIDPMSFISHFNRKQNESDRFVFCRKAKDLLNMSSPIPSDSYGLPTFMPHNLLFFGYSIENASGAIDNDWALSRELNSEAVSESTFNKVLTNKNVAVPKLTQIMYICKPNTYICLNSTMRKYFKKKGINASVHNYNEYIQVLKQIREQFKQQTFAELVHEAFVFDLKNPHKKKEPNRSEEQTESRYWAISPNENASHWEDFKANDIIAIGWDKLGDLRTYKDKEAIKEAIQKEWGIGSSHVNSTLACYEFLHVLKPGDYVFAKKGMSKLLGYGKVISDYFYDEQRDWGKNVRKIQWIKTGEWDLPEKEMFAVKTLTDITDFPDFIKNLYELMDGKPEEKPKPPFTVANALDELFIDEVEFNDILTALKLKKNIILQGPPGVGKTFIAKRLAYTLIGYEDKTKVEMIQFHQSYSYEDFIQGYRPTDDGKFDLKNGVFYEFCKKAQRDKDNKYVFIIDEINRGNLSKIFGELMMLIEADKRGEEMPLTYSPELKFNIPSNVYMIGTMNTADRSLALVDYALRRRFRFIKLHPKFSSQKFKDFLAEKGVDNQIAQMIIERFGRLNQKISNDHKDLGEGYQIGHSFFCPDGEKISYGKEWYESIIRHEIEPLLEEYWCDNSKTAESHVKDLLQ